MTLSNHCIKELLVQLSWLANTKNESYANYLSPLLFNLFVNELLFVTEKSESEPFIVADVTRLIA